jgi:hypothetical protein
MITIEKTGPRGEKLRLVARGVLGASDFQAIANTLGIEPLEARKTALTAARLAKAGEHIETHWNGLETVNTAKTGDWVATSLTADGKVLRDGSGHANSYIIPAAAFPTLYAPVAGSNEFGTFYAARGTVTALHLSGGFEILAPWGERQTAPDGYLVLSGSDVYGNNAETFAATYQVVNQEA